jgi:hypothetical protein
MGLGLRWRRRLRLQRLINQIASRRDAEPRREKGRRPLPLRLRVFYEKALSVKGQRGGPAGLRPAFVPSTRLFHPRP